MISFMKFILGIGSSKETVSPFFCVTIGRSWFRFLSGTQNFSLSHARVMLISSLFTLLYCTNITCSKWTLKNGCKRQRRKSKQALRRQIHGPGSRDSFRTKIEPSSLRKLKLRRNITSARKYFSKIALVHCRAFLVQTETLEPKNEKKIRYGGK